MKKNDWFFAIAIIVGLGIIHALRNINTPLAGVYAGNQGTLGDTTVIENF